ncbi:MAG: hypothetical protein EU532_08470 [Promethearchaeota archaeon]|nr:MAG: hypothetical protein EU532_08470 [Candidatus Lokiarchaeota archaeon]
MSLQVITLTFVYKVFSRKVVKKWITKRGKADFYASPSPFSMTRLNSDFEVCINSRTIIRNVLEVSVEIPALQYANEFSIDLDFGF